MKKLFAVFLFAVCTVCAVLAGCAPDNYRGLNFGKYYLENSDDVYIEIKADHQAYLHNLDFSDFNPEEYWGHNELWAERQLTKEQVVDWMQGEREYYLIDNDVTFFIRQNDDYGAYCIVFNYNGKNELKSNYNNDVYILRK